jgi:hypothetical protein
MIKWHKHHIVPKHQGGTDDPSNLIKVNIAMHAFMHKMLYEEHHNPYDLIAYKVLSHNMTFEEARIEASKVEYKGLTKEQIERSVATRRANGSFASEKNSMYGKKHTIESIELMRNAKMGEKNPMYGKKNSDITRQKMSQSQMGKSVVFDLYDKKMVSIPRSEFLANPDRYCGPTNKRRYL